MGGELEIRELDFEAAFDAATGVFVLSGNADATVSDQLHELVIRVQEHCLKTGASVRLDLRTLEFMAASCFNAFVVWVGWINELPVEQRYELRFVSNPTLPWQKRSLATLTCFATDLVKVET